MPTVQGLTIQSLLVPAAEVLPSNAAYLAHLNVAATNRTLIRLASNENTEPPSPAVRVALEQAYNDAHLYPPTVPPLRTTLADRHQVDVASIVIGAGATEVIDAALRAFVRRGDEVVIARPSWPVYRRRLDALEATIREVPLQKGSRTFSYNTDAMLAAVTPRTKMVIVCTPNNPTGHTMALADIRRCADTGRALLLDNAYADFSPENDLSPLVREYENVLLARTFSKAYCLAGLRLGYMVGRAAIMDYIDRFLVPGSSVSSAALHAGAAALEDDAYYRRQVARIIEERGRLTQALRELQVDVYDSRANFVALDAAAWPGGARGFAGSLLEHGVVVRVLEEPLVRITVGTPHENDVVIASVQSMMAASSHEGRPR